MYSPFRQVYWDYGRQVIDEKSKEFPGEQLSTQIVSIGFDGSVSIKGLFDGQTHKSLVVSRVYVDLQVMHLVLEAHVSQTYGHLVH